MQTYQIKKYQKSIAYADDLSICIISSSTKYILLLLKEFEEVSSLSINFSISEILTKGNKTYTMKKVQTIKLLGVKINLQKNITPETKTQLIQKCETAPKFVGPSISLRARARNFETFIMSKVIYQLRHYNNCKTFMKKLNSQLIDHLWMGKTFR